MDLMRSQNGGKLRPDAYVWNERYLNSEELGEPLG